MVLVEHRLLFVEDLFKILTWMVTLQNPEQLEHLLPGVKQPTGNGHFITWNNTGLLKQFGRDDIQLDLINRVYTANLAHVERGRANGRSVIITSIGITLHNAIRRGIVTAAEDVIQQLRQAVDELHGIGVGHCDICTDNMFVLDDGTVILGDLEFCTDRDAVAPLVRRLYGNPATALELDENQVIKCNEDIRERMGA